MLSVKFPNRIDMPGKDCLCVQNPISKFTKLIQIVFPRLFFLRARFIAILIFGFFFLLLLCCIRVELCSYRAYLLLLLLFLFLYHLTIKLI